jgi:hypothetical protein
MAGILSDQASKEMTNRRRQTLHPPPALDSKVSDDMDKSRLSLQPPRRAIKTEEPEEPARRRWSRIGQFPQALPKWSARRFSTAHRPSCRGAVSPGQKLAEWARKGANLNSSRPSNPLPAKWRPLRSPRLGPGTPRTSRRPGTGLLFGMSQAQQTMDRRERGVARAAPYAAGGIEPGETADLSPGSWDRSPPSSRRG